jgi:hypothetical protein
MPGWTKHGKRRIAQSMYQRGLSFIGASVLLQQKAGYSFVCAHLMCQGLEIVLKSLLLFNDYDKYLPKLDNKFSHNLVRLANKASQIYGLKPMRLPLRDELDTMNNLYKSHFLRYGDARDLFLDPNSIHDKLLVRRVIALVRLANRELNIP